MSVALPDDAFPDGDPSARVEELQDDGLFARFLRGVALVVIGLFAFSWVLGQLRSEALGYLFVPAVLAALVYLAKLAQPWFARVRSHSMAAWQQRTGMRWLDALPDAEHPARLLVELGVRPSLHGLVLEGRPFEGAPASARLADATFGSGRDAEAVTLLELPLPDRRSVVPDEVSLTFGTRLGDALDPIERGFLRWPIVSFERADRAARVRVRAPEGTDSLPIWNLFDPALLVRLEAAAPGADQASIGMLVRDGALLTWCAGHLVERGAAEFVATGAREGASVAESLGAFLDLTELVYVRLAH